jgi:hypothetical protein
MNNNFVNKLHETLSEIELYNFSIQESFKNEISMACKEKVLKRNRTNFEYDQKYILKEWLLNNKTYPYPTDNDKLMFSLETGLTKNQIDVCNVHYNNRVC